MITCTYCKVRNPDSAPFCQACGAPFISEVQTEDTGKWVVHVGDDHKIARDYIRGSRKDELVRDYAERMACLQRDYQERRQDEQEEYRRKMYELMREYGG